jgi:hypothetical protein
MPTTRSRMARDKAQRALLRERHAPQHLTTLQLREAVLRVAAATRPLWGNNAQRLERTRLEIETMRRPLVTRGKAEPKPPPPLRDWRLPIGHVHAVDCSRRFTPADAMALAPRPGITWTSPYWRPHP